ncbi:chondroitinase family polysaccharide lyase [Pseudactinotalea sp. Z1739]|uniref:chondroitinase family polysaccharide lyase n=1 Tax=Pseudactinotalea sp. Z1739 TaxID=3413028 RepID=UPI003C7C7ED3
MSQSPLSRRHFLAGAALATAGAALPSNIRPAFGLGPVRTDVSPAQLERELAELDKPIYLLENVIPDTFSVEDDSEISISGAHGNIGIHSLQWDFDPGAHLRIEGDLSYSEPSGGVTDYFSVWIYNETPIDDYLRFTFGRGDTVDAWFDFHLNFHGWRTCWVRYSDDTDGTPHPGMDRITVVAPDNHGTLWIDQLVTNISIRPDRPTPDFQVPTLAPEFPEANNYHWMGLLDFWHKQDSPGFDSGNVTQAEIDDAETIRDRLLTRQRANPSFNDAALASLEDRFTEFGVPELADPYAEGDDLRPANVGAKVNHNQIAIFPAQYRQAVQEFTHVVALRGLWERCGLPAAQTWDHATRQGATAAADRAAQLVLRLLTHLHDQGWATGSGQGTIHHIGYAYRAWASSVLMLEPLLRERGIWERTSTSVAWYAGTGRLTDDFTENQHRSGLVDVLNTLMEGLLSSCFFAETWPERVGRLRAFKAWIDRAYSYAPGTEGGFKPDGSMYHHVGPYPIYGRDALSGSTVVITDCVGTAFALGGAGQKVLRNALHHQALIANTIDYPVSQGGRHQTGAWHIRPVINPFGLTARTRLDGESGLDEEQAAMFRRLVPPDASNWQRNLDAQFEAAGIQPAPAPNGYWAFPYGAAGLSRQDEWLVTIKTHNNYIWATEIYDQQNVFGRYQTYGQISIQADVDGDSWVSLTENGWAQPGYDWNFIPGATTKTLPFDELATTVGASGETLPLSESRFGGFGALEDHATVFGMELIEHPAFDPSHTARISALMVGDRVIALGSRIRNNDSANPTRTTLFQVSSEVMSNPRDVQSGDDWITDPTGNGYVVVEGPALTHRTAEQTAPDWSGNGEGTQVVALGYLDHGTAPQDSQYAYVILVQAGADRTASFAAAMAGPQEPVRIHQRDAIAHVVTDVESQVSAHIVFEPDTDLVAESVVRSLSRQGLVLSRPTGSGAIDFSVTDPDLHLYEGIDEEQYDGDGNYVGNLSPYSRPWRYNESPQTQTTVVLRGPWELAQTRDDVHLDTTTDGDTTITVTTQHGTGVQFSLTPGASIETVRTALDTYISDGLIAGPIAHRLADALEQAEKHLDGGRSRPAIGALERFIRHLDDPERSDTLDTQAAADLRKQAASLLSQVG